MGQHIEYMDVIRLVRDRCEEPGANPEYQRGQVELVADLFPERGTDTDDRVAKIEDDLWSKRRP